VKNPESQTIAKLTELLEEARRVAALPTEPKPSEPKRRQRRPKYDDAWVAKLHTELPKNLKPSASYFFPDPSTPKFGVRLRADGLSGAFTVICRDPRKKQKWVKIGRIAEMKIEEARAAAREVIRRIEAGKTPFEPPPVEQDSVTDVCEGWLQRHVEGGKKGPLRTAREMRRIVRRYILPVWGKRKFVDIRRTDITKLIDDIEDNSGAFQADAVLVVLRSVAHWFAKRNDDYAIPFVKGMNRVDAETRKRGRVLDDDEIRRVWQAAGDTGAFGAYVRLLLLTGQRREKIIGMKWDHVDLDAGVWDIETLPREKGNGGMLLLPPVAIEIIKAQPRLATSPYVFALNRGFNSRLKKEFDAACNVHGWRIHDLRRCARSLLSRAGINNDHAEMVLGHSLGPIREHYDRHAYFTEKGHALAALAALIETIVNPPEGDNVVPFEAAAS